MIDAAADDQQVNFDGVWDDVQARAERRFRTDVIAALGDRYRIKRLMRSVNIQRIVDTATTRTAAAEYRGLTIELNEANDDFVTSNLQVLKVQSLNIYLSSGVASLDLVIYDLDTDELLYSATTGALVAGWNTININQRFWDSRRIFIAYDATAINSVNLELGNIDNFYTWNWEWCRGRVRGAYAATGTPTTVTQGSDAYAMSAIVSIGCDYDAFVCQNTELFAYSWAHCLASELMSELMFTDRLNRWTTVNRKEIDRMKAYFEVQYRGGTFEEIEYDGYLPTAIFGVNMDQDDICLECNDSYRFEDGI
jgi:hypothetical protein